MSDNSRRAERLLMKRLNTTHARVLGIATLLAVGCGSDDKPKTNTTDPTPSESQSDTSKPPEEDTTGGEDTGSTTPGVGDPVLEDVPPDTELSDLTDDQRAEVCAAYVKTATAVNANLGSLCPAQALFLAAQSSEVTDDEGYRAECAVQLDACETQVEAAQEDSPEDRCEKGVACAASIKDFNDCNAQIAALNELVLQPLVKRDLPECSEMTRTQGATAALLLGIEVGANMELVTKAAGGSPTDEDGPCARIGEACPDLGVSLGAFDDLGSQLP